ncbi:hypothetical protein D047_4911A, partial [Vibrio parahaemolyticus VPTS-2010_2]
MQHLPYQ